jgi:hypothetical protein
VHKRGRYPLNDQKKKREGGVFFIETSVFVGRASARQGRLKSALHRRLMGDDAEDVHKFSGFEWRRYAAHCTITRHVDSSGAMPVGYCALRELLIRHTGMGSAGIQPLRVDKDTFQARCWLWIPAFTMPV